MLEVEPYNGNATLNLAVIYMNLQRNNEAENCLKRVLVISPGNKEALYTLGILLEREHRYLLLPVLHSWLELHVPSDMKKQLFT